MAIFSQRTNWSFESNPLVARVNEIRDSGEEIIDLTESNPTRCGFNYPEDSILRPLSGSRNLLYAPQAMGDCRARESLAQFYRQKGQSVDPESFFLTASTSESYSVLFRLLSNPGEKILFPRPSYPLFEYLARLNDVDLDYYSLVYDQSWRIDLDSLKKSVSSKTRAILLVSPNNPTGSFLKNDELAFLNEMCRTNDMALICDEVFADFRFSENRAIVPSVCRNEDVLTFSLAGASKTLGLPQMKVGWSVVSGPDDIKMRAIKRLEVILDTYLSVNTPAMSALPEWLMIQPKIHREIMGHLIENLSCLERTLGAVPGCHSLSVEGGWYGVIRLPDVKSDDEWVMEFLDKDRVFVHPGYFFDFAADGYLIVSLLPDPKIFREGINRMEQRIKTQTG